MTVPIFRCGFYGRPRFTVLIAGALFNNLIKKVARRDECSRNCSWSIHKVQ